MRLVVIPQAADLKLLRKTLFTGRQNAAAIASALDRVQRLNPHLDLQHLAAGTVLLLPDLPGLDAAGSRAVGDDVFEVLSGDIASGLKLAGRRVRAAAKEQDAERGAVEEAVGTDPVRRAMHADDALRQQVEAAQARFDSEREQAEQAVNAIESIEHGAAAELAALRKLLGLGKPEG